MTTRRAGWATLFGLMAVVLTAFVLVFPASVVGVTTTPASTTFLSVGNGKTPTTPVRDGVTPALTTPVFPLPAYHWCHTTTASNNTAYLDWNAHTLFVNASCSLVGSQTFAYNISVGSNANLTFRDGSFTLLQRTWNATYSGAAVRAERDISLYNGNLALLNATLGPANATGDIRSWDPHGDSKGTASLPIREEALSAAPASWYTARKLPTCNGLLPVTPVFEMVNSHLTNNSTVDWATALTGNDTPFCAANGLVAISHSTINGSLIYATSTAIIQNLTISYFGLPTAIGEVSEGGSTQTASRLIYVPSVDPSSLALTSFQSSGPYYHNYALELRQNRAVGNCTNATLTDQYGSVAVCTQVGFPAPWTTLAPVLNLTSATSLTINQYGYAYATLFDMATFDNGDPTGVCNGVQPLGSNVAETYNGLTLHIFGAVQTGIFTSSNSPGGYGGCPHLGVNLTLAGVSVTTGPGFQVTQMKNPQPGNYATENITAIASVDDNANVTLEASNLLLNMSVWGAASQTHLGFWIWNATNVAVLSNIFTDTASEHVGYQLPYYVANFVTYFNAPVAATTTETGYIALSTAAGQADFSVIGNTITTAKTNYTGAPASDKAATLFEGPMENLFASTLEAAIAVSFASNTVNAGAGWWCPSGVGTSLSHTLSVCGVLGYGMTDSNVAFTNNTVTLASNGTVRVVYAIYTTYRANLYDYANFTGNTIAVTQTLGNYNWVLANLIDPLSLSSGIWAMSTDVVPELSSSRAVLNLYDNNLSLTAIRSPTWPAVADQGTFEENCPLASTTEPCGGYASMFGSPQSASDWGAYILWNVRGNTMSLHGQVTGFGGTLKGATLVPTADLGIYGAPIGTPVATGTTIKSSFDYNRLLDSAGAFFHSPEYPNVAFNLFNATGQAVLFNSYLVTGQSSATTNNLPWWFDVAYTADLYVGKNTFAFDATSLFSLDATDLVVSDQNVPQVELWSTPAGTCTTIDPSCIMAMSLYINAVPAKITLAPGPTSNYEALVYGSMWVLDDDKGMPAYGSWTLSAPATSFSTSPYLVQTGGVGGAVWLYNDIFAYTDPSGSSPQSTFTWQLAYNGTVLLNQSETTDTYLNLQHFDGNQVVHGAQLTEHMNVVTDDAPAYGWQLGCGSIGVRACGAGTGPSGANTVAFFDTIYAPSRLLDTNHSMPSSLPLKAQLPSIDAATHVSGSTATVMFPGGTGEWDLGQPLAPLVESDPVFGGYHHLLHGGTLNLSTAAAYTSALNDFKWNVSFETSFVSRGQLANTTWYNSTAGYAVSADLVNDSFGPSQPTVRDFTVGTTTLSAGARGLNLTLEFLNLAPNKPYSIYHNAVLLPNGTSSTWDFPTGSVVFALTAPNNDTYSVTQKFTWGVPGSGFGLLLQDPLFWFAIIILSAFAVASSLAYYVGHKHPRRARGAA